MTSGNTDFAGTREPMATPRMNFPGLARTTERCITNRHDRMAPTKKASESLAFYLFRLPKSRQVAQLADGTQVFISTS
jgi:hypothetical protein